jgi:hypothetical protein
VAFLLETVASQLAQTLGGEPPPPEVLDGLGDRLQELESFSVGLDANGLDQWLSKFRALFNDQVLRDTLLVRALQKRATRLAEALTLLGIVRIEINAATSRVRACTIDRVRLQAFLTNPGSAASDLTWWFSKIQTITDVKLIQAYLGLLLTAPDELLALEYAGNGFAGLPEGTPPPATTLDDLLNLVNSPLRLKLPITVPLTLESFQAAVDNDAPDDYLALVGPDTVPSPPSLAGFGVELKLQQPQALLGGKRLDLGGGWSAVFETMIQANGLYQIKATANGIDPAATSTGEAEIRVTREGEPAILVGPASGTRFEVKRASVSVTFLPPPSEARFSVRALLDGIALVLATDALKTIGGMLPVPPEIRFTTSVSLGYLQGQGFQGQGGAGAGTFATEVVAPIGLNVGTSGLGLAVDRVTVRLEAAFAADGALYGRVVMTHGATGQLGPIRLTIDGAGGWVGWWQAGDGSPATGGVELPSGIGLAIEAGPASGGGFLGRVGAGNAFHGALQLKILGIGAFAFGIYELLPGGDSSFVALIGIRFPIPGIQIGFGFAISGFGGLIGINRRADTDRLRERFGSGAAGNVLFNDDPMRNAPVLLHDLGQFFPAEPGIFIIGPTLQINWLELLRLDAGVFIELPGPRKLFIAGSGRLVIGVSEEAALVYLRLDFIGGIDFVKQLFYFDAALINSHIVHILRLTGGAALRINYGDNGYFLFSVGGFHPSFNPGAMELPRLDRVGATMALDVAIARAWLKQAMYLALTSNTFQLGSSIEAGIEIGPISAHGWFGFDALIQFKPFSFIARIDAGFDVDVFGVSLCSVRVEGQLSGPRPLVIQAKASVRILFVKVSASVTLRLIDGEPDTVAPITDVVGVLRPELTDPNNLRAEGDDPSVVFRPADDLPAAEKRLPLLVPTGTLIWEQRKAPLGLEIERLLGVPLASPRRLEVATPGHANEPEHDWFGVGTYRVLRDAEALNNPRLSRERSGVKVAAKPSTAPSVDCPIEINVIKLPSPIPIGIWNAKVYLTLGQSRMFAQIDRVATLPAQEKLITLKPETWQVVGAEGLPVATGLGPMQAFTATKASSGSVIAATDVTVDLAGVL